MHFIYVSLLIFCASSLMVSGGSRIIFTDLTDINLPSDYSFQGEYRGEAHGAQVISLDNGKFQAVLFVGGLLERVGTWQTEV